MVRVLLSVVSFCPLVVAEELSVICMRCHACLCIVQVLDNSTEPEVHTQDLHVLTYIHTYIHTYHAYIQLGWMRRKTDRRMNTSNPDWLQTFEFEIDGYAPLMTCRPRLLVSARTRLISPACSR
jgi:hypothetical protein